MLLEFSEDFCTNQKMKLALQSILLQLQALGLLWKLVTGPWMAIFYTPAVEHKHFEMTEYLKHAMAKLEAFEECPDIILSSREDVFGRPLVEDETLQTLRILKNDVSLCAVLTRLVDSFLSVLKHQFGDLANPTEEQLQSAFSAPVHNIWAVQTLGMFDAQLHRAPNSCIEFLDAMVKATFNKTLQWFEEHSENEQTSLAQFAAELVTKTKKKARRERRLKTDKEIMNRMKLAQQSKGISKRKKLEKEVRHRGRGKIVRFLMG